ncbi:MAG TPA: MMPL family transporter [Gaiellaceae bacterium]|nr:MMPL family transporter [Gaiellaceae bacterium]
MRTPRCERLVGHFIARLTTFCLRHRALVVAAWLAVVVLGVAGTLRLVPLLQNGFTLPGTDSTRVQQILTTRFGNGANAPIVLVAQGSHAHARAVAAAHTAERALPGGRITDLERLPSGAAVAFVQTSLPDSRQTNAIGPLRTLLGPRILVTGDAALGAAINPVLAHALKVGELYLAVPIALLILLAVFASGSALLPFLIAGATIPTSLGLAWIVAHYLQLTNYLLNMTSMIGLAIAIDYSLLVVHRYRDERRRGLDHEDAVFETMMRAGRTLLFSGLAVSLGLALMLLLPVPFLRGFGLGGLLVPAVSVVCALTLLPALLSLVGDRLERIRLVPHRLMERRHAGESRLWHWHAGWVMRRARIVAPLVAGLLALAAMPLLGMQLGPGSPTGLPKSLPAMRGLAVLQHGSPSNTLDPTTIVVNAGKAHQSAATAPAMARLTGLLRHDREVATVAPAVHDPTGRYFEVNVVTRHDPYGAQAQAFAGRLRGTIIPAARFAAGVHVLAGGGAAYAADFISRTLGSFPYLILGVLALTYLLLVRAFRSLLLPLKAIVLNLFTVSAATGLMIAVFQWGWGSGLGLTRSPVIEAWIPVFMFTLLFGLSMDYEVFLVSSMRESWDKTKSNTGAVAHGLANTGRIVTAAGLIMAAAFSGLIIGAIPTMQQLGFGLAAAILIDITLVRGLLLPSTMALVGRWNWYLPAWTARVLLVREQPVAEISPV